MGTDIGPFPSTLVVNTVTVMSVDGAQVDVATTNTSLHVPSSQEEAGMVVEPQIIPEVKSE